MDWLALWLTLKLAAFSTLILLLVGLPLAAWLAASRWPGRSIVEALVAMPLVLPPTVIGFYLLLALAPGGWLGGPWEQLTGQRLAFSFTGLVIGSVLYSLPFVVQPLQQGFERLPHGLLAAAATLGATPIDRLLSVTLPLMAPALLIAVALGFAHTVGEFGVVLLVGGNIPGETRVLSMALFDHIETLDYAAAHRLAGGLLLCSLLLLTALYSQRRRLRLW